MSTYDGRYSRISMGKREEKELGIPHNWTELDPHRTDLKKQTILVFGGNTTNTSEEANGYAKCVESLLDKKYRKNTDILSFSYSSEPIKNGAGNSKFLEPEYAVEIHQIFDSLLKPLLYDRLGRMKEKQGIEKAFHNLIFVGHCGGCNFVDLIIDDFYATLLDKYPPATAELLIKKIQYFAYAPNELPNHDVTSFFINPYIDPNYSWDKVIALIAHQGFDVDYPRNISKQFLKGNNKYVPGNVFENAFQNYRATLFKSGQGLYLIPSRMNPDYSTGDHSIGCVTKDNIVYSNTEYEKTAQIANNSAKMVINQFASEKQLDHRFTFESIARLIYNNPPEYQPAYE